MSSASEPRRFDLIEYATDSLVEKPDGAWVLYEDFAAYRADLEAKVRALLIEDEGTLQRCVVCRLRTDLGHREGCEALAVLRLLTDGAEPPKAAK